MVLKDFIDKVVISTDTRERYLLTKIHSSYIQVRTEKPGSSGYPSHDVWETINGDPFKRGLLVFEDESLAKPFRELYDEYTRTEDAYWESYGYWLHKSY